MTAPRPARAPRRGFTLVELLVAIVILAIVGGTLGTLLVSQYRIFNRTRATTGMQRDLRTGLGLLPLDLRGASRAGADFTSLTDTAIALRATIGSSVVCARPAVRVISLPPRNGARADLTQWHSTPGPGDQVLVYDENTRTGPDDDRWLPYTVVSFDSTTADCTGAPFTDAALDPPATKKRFRVTLDADLPITVVAGMPVRFLRQTRYSLYRPGTSADDWYLGYREMVAGTWTAIEPIAGPFEAPSGTMAGIRFTYFDTLGQALAVPTATTVGRVDLSFRSRNLLRGAGARDSLVLRDSLSVRVALRNRQ
jgi:prepilin-type N-terminal cleavage/methylation domain-containing protein